MAERIRTKQANKPLPEKSPVKVSSIPDVRTLRWKKIGGGVLRLPNRIIKPNQIFEATIDEIPAAFRDTLVCMDQDTYRTQMEAREIEAQKVNLHFELVPVSGEDGTELFNIVGANDKIINQNPLPRDMAEELKNALEA